VTSEVGRPWRSGGLTFTLTPELTVINVSSSTSSQSSSREGNKINKMESVCLSVNTSVKTVIDVYLLSCCLLVLLYNNVFTRSRSLCTYSHLVSTCILQASSSFLEVRGHQPRLRLRATSRVQNNPDLFDINFPNNTFA